MISARQWFKLDNWFNNLLPKKGTAIIVCWNLSHNPLGRAFLFYDFLKRRYKTKLVGPIFKKFGKEIWRPLRKVDLDVEVFEASNFPDFLSEANECANRIEHADVVVICKPRLPSVLIGLLIAEKTGAKIILDIDDYELAFFENRDPLELDDAISQGLDLTNPYHETWTRICHSLIKHFPNKVVSNYKLQEMFGGIIIPHVRNERIFNPILYNRKKIRAKHGYTEKDKVILFLGTPREHKGFEEIPKALKEIGNRNYKFCLIGKIRNDELRERFHQEYGDFAQIFNDSDFRDLPEKLMIADLICLLQDEDSLVSEYQLPAKLMDAISMGIPVIATPVGPLESLHNEGFINPINSKEDLVKWLDEIFKNLDQHKSLSNRNRAKCFEGDYSYYSANKIVSNLFSTASTSISSVEIIEEIERTWSEFRDQLETRKNDIITNFKNLTVPKIKEPSVSIIVLTHNGLEHLQRLIPSINENTLYSNYELIIWDNASADDTLGYLESLDKPTVKILKSNKNMSFSEANNIANKSANGDLLLFLNNDIEVTHGWLTRLVDTHQKIENVGALGCRLIYPIKEGFEHSLKIQHDGIGFEEIKGEIKPVNLGKGEALDLRNSRIEKVLGVTGACLLIQKDLFFNVDGFDEAYNYGYEDVDLCLKLRQKAHFNYVDKSVVLFHHEFGSQENDTRDEIKKRRLKNNEVLKSKWVAALEKVFQERE